LHDTNDTLQKAETPLFSGEFLLFAINN
jgi:hypothetical protein